MAAEKYKWSFYSLGGVTRVNIQSGQDIAHLGELDMKLWTALSCPTTGLEFNQKFLSLMDTDKDGKIKTKEVVAASKYVTGALKDPNVLVNVKDTLSLSDLNTENELGKRLADTISLIKDGTDTSITGSNVADYMAKLNAMTFEVAAKDVIVPPYGADTDAVAAAYNALDAKVKDYFMRCKLLVFNGDCSSVIDTSVTSLGNFSAGDLSAHITDIAAMPLAKPQTSMLLPSVENVNPVWKEQYKAVVDLALASDNKATAYGEKQWEQVGANLSAYFSAVEAQNSGAQNELIAKRDAQLASAKELDEFICLYTYLYDFIRNYVVFSDFYSRDDSQQAVFQAGKLFIDQRCCELCVRVSDLGKHADMAKLSGMFLIYCHCWSYTGTEQMDIVAVLTEGDVKDLRAGKNAVFIDRDGKDWYATVTNIVDNPVSIRQAFWSPYRKFGRWCSEKINKMAADRENKVSENMTAAASGDASKKQQVFDVAKFAGIFAAVGLAIGSLGSFLDKLVDKCLLLHWWQFLIIFAVILLLISGPSMFIAWGKLRKRDLGPVLNANGWAINARVLVNVRFGHTLTSLAKYPKLDLKNIGAADPYAKKKSSFWPWFFAILIVLVAAFAAMYFLGYFSEWINF
ncbi:MAG: hypothetical protein MJY71_00840 [Bacteroidaceae bacterium]|nr:hypothetical protein [Bacteroidaceae bacterium]